MNFGDRGTGRACHDSERQRGSILLRIPRLVQTREKQEAAGSRVNPERLPLSFGADPFVKTIGWYDATVLLKGFAEGWPLFERLGLRVDTLAGAPVIPGPAIDQTPARPSRFSAFEFRSDDKVLIGRRDIEARPIAGRRRVHRGRQARRRLAATPPTGFPYNTHLPQKTACCPKKFQAFGG